MKRFFVLILALLLLLPGCAAEPAAPTEPVLTMPPTGPTTVPAATEPVTEPVTEPTTEPAPTEPEPTEPVVLYRHPLNGRPIDEPFNGRLMAVVINNVVYALPQHGISKADFIFELETEGGVTRQLAIFSELNNVTKIGPIRSARTYFNAIARSFDAPIVHCGSSYVANQGYMDYFETKASPWLHMDSHFAGKYFYRDKDRLSKGFATEHTLFTTGEKLLTAMENRDYNKTYDGGLDLGFSFADNINLNGETANKITVTYNGSKKMKFTYDANEGVYNASQYGKKYVDGNTGDSVDFKNVLVLFASQKKVKSEYGNHSFYDLIGSGKGYYACNGQVIPIKWKHSKYSAPFSFTTEDGEPITLGVGESYVGITSVKKLAYE